MLPIFCTPSSLDVPTTLVTALHMLIAVMVSSPMSLSLMKTGFTDSTVTDMRGDGGSRVGEVQASQIPQLLMGA